MIPAVQVINEQIYSTNPHKGSPLEVISIHMPEFVKEQEEHPEPKANKR